MNAYRNDSFFIDLKRLKLQILTFVGAISGDGYSAADFFTQDVVEEIKPLLAMGKGGHLHDLILELLADSQVNNRLMPELSLIVLNPTKNKLKRSLVLFTLLKTYFLFFTLYS
ncbi:hypothetical protein M5G07_07415 [Serratia symbiotica]|nr:hypothetical protein [Serratia symbiotica]